MKIKKFKFSVDEIYNSLSMLDLRCEWFDILHPKYKKKIGFDNDVRGNGKGPYLELTCYPKYVKFTRGTHLKQDEKKILFPYQDFDSVDEFTDYLATFVIQYFKSIKLVRK